MDKFPYRHCLSPNTSAADDRFRFLIADRNSPPALTSFNTQIHRFCDLSSCSAEFVDDITFSVSVRVRVIWL